MPDTPWKCPPSDQRAQCRALFLVQGAQSTQRLFATAMEGHLPATGLRGLAWRFFLGTLPAGAPMASWAAHAEEQRSKYAALVEEHCVDPNRKGAELDPAICNPLSQHEESPWGSFFETQELRTEIKKDLTRLHPGYTREGEDTAFFTRTAVIDSMERVLVVWSRQHANLSYRQGMHELLAALILAVHNDAEQAAASLPAAPAGGAAPPAAPPASAPSGDGEAQTLSDAELTALLRTLLAPAGVEADAYWLFDQLMQSVKNWFEPGAGGGGGGGGAERRASVEEQRRARQAAERTSPLLVKCAHIQDTLLRRADPQLHGVLLAKEVQPQLYLLRWLRLLFGREFHLSDSMLVWDALFAYGQGLQLVEYMAVAMLLYVRASLIEGDYTSTLRRLLKHARTS